MTTEARKPSRRAEETAARREERLRREAEALRANLRRRKQQDRARAATPELPAAPQVPSGDEAG